MHARIAGFNMSENSKKNRIDIVTVSGLSYNIAVN